MEEESRDGLGEKSLSQLLLVLTRTREGLLGTKRAPKLTATKKTGPQSYNGVEPNSANNQMSLETNSPLQPPEGNATLLEPSFHTSETLSIAIT